MSDAAIERLRALDDRPDFSATRYDVLEEIGRGGMGIVFRGRDRELERDVAIKVTAWSTTADADRLRREARTLAALEHPGIVPVHDVGQLAGRPRVRRDDAGPRRAPRRLRRAAAARTTGCGCSTAICDTVSFAHARGVIHRDLKPANIMIGPFGQVLVLDWGLARPGSDPGGDHRGQTPAVTLAFSTHWWHGRLHGAGASTRKCGRAIGRVRTGRDPGRPGGRFRIAIAATPQIRDRSRTEV